MNTETYHSLEIHKTKQLEGKRRKQKEEDLPSQITLVPTLAERRIYIENTNLSYRTTKSGEILFHPNFTVNTFLITYIYELIIRSLFFIINFSSGKRRGTTNQIRTVIAQNRSWAIFRELEEPDTTHKNNNLRSTRFLSSLSLSLFPFSFQHIIIIEFTGDTYRFYT